MRLNKILILLGIQLILGCKSDQKINNDVIEKSNLSDSSTISVNVKNKTEELKDTWNLKSNLNESYFSDSRVGILFKMKENRVVGELKGTLDKDEGSVVYVDAIIDSIIILNDKMFNCMLLPHEFYNSENHNEKVGGLNEYTKLIGTIVYKNKLNLRDYYGEYYFTLDLIK